MPTVPQCLIGGKEGNGGAIDKATDRQTGRFGGGVTRMGATAKCRVRSSIAILLNCSMLLRTRSVEAAAAAAASGNRSK